MRKYFIVFVNILIVMALFACGSKNISISFNTNGGSQVQTIVIKQQKEIEEPITTREGYTFMGWYKDSKLEEAFNFKDGAVRNLTLYAKWEINNYTISFQTNSDEVLEPKTIVYQGTISLSPPIDKLGFSFAGWYEDEELSKAFTATKMPAKDFTLYAKWSPVVVVVSFYVDGTLVESINVNQGNPLTNYPAVPSKTGYTGSWSVLPDKVYDENFSVDAVYTIITYTVKFVDEEDNLFYEFPVNYGDKIPAFAQPTKAGYDFARYSEDVLDAEVTKNLNIIVYFTPKMFTVNFRVNGVLIKTENVAYKKDATPPTVIEEGYEFVNWDGNYTEVTSNEEVKAILQVKDYQVILSGNGGLIEEEETHTLTFAYKSTIKVEVTPTREGYHFDGWYANALGTGDEVILLGLSMPAADLKVYAKWEINTYAINYENLFNTQHSNPRNYKVTSNITLANPTSRIGYSFVGWYDSESEGNKIIKIENSTGNKVLYARWEINQYTITFNTDGGSAIEPIVQDYNTEISPIENPLRAGYTFIAWDKTIPAFMPAENIFLKANWSLINYEVEYVLDDSVNHEDNPVSYTIETTTINLEEPEKTGYTFQGWYLDEEFKNPVEKIVKGSTGNITLYAKFIINSYNVVFVDYDQTEIASEVVEYGASAQEPEKPTRIGYDFTGWSQDFSNVIQDLLIVANYELIIYTIDYIGIDQSINPNPISYDITKEVIFINPLKDGYLFLGWYEDDVLITKINLGSIGNKSIEAKFELINYNIDYYNLEEFEVNSNPNSYNIETETITLAAPTNVRFGYSFKGWYEDEALTKPITEIVKGSFNSLKLYASIAANSHTITYYVEGKIVGEIERYLYGDEITIRENLIKHGYSFSWDKELPATMPNNDIEVEGAFKPIEYLISYNLAGGTHSGNPIRYTIESNEIVFNDAVKTGYQFLGWYDSETEGSLVTNIPSESTGDIILYARYQAKEYTITFDYNNGLEPTTLNVEYDKAFVLPEAIKLGYSFVGWTYLGNLFAAEVWQIDADITLVAAYSLDDFILTISGYEGPVVYPEDIKLSGSTNSPLSDYITYKWQKGEEVLSTSSTYIVEGVLNSGTYKLIAILNHQENQKIIEKSVDVVITKATYDMSGVSFVDKEVTYNGNVQELVITGTLPDGVSVSYLNNANKDAGVYDDVTAVFTGDYDNYNQIENIVKTLTINKAASLITADDINKVYDGNTYTIVASLNHSEASLSYSNNNGQVNVGEYEVTIEVESSTNYLAASVKRTIKITAKPITVTANNDSKVYGQVDPIFTYEVLGLVGDDKLDGKLTRESGENVDTYQIKQGNLANGNYLITFQEGTFEIVKATYDMSDVSFVDISYVYDKTEKSILITGELPAGVSVSYLYNKLTDVGSTSAIAKFTIADPDNYNLIADRTAKLTITKATYDMSGVFLVDKAVTYNGSVQELVITGTLPDGVSVSYLNNANKNAGVYDDVTAVFTGDYDNYNNITNLTATLTINKLVIIVTPKENQSKIFEATDPTLTYTHTPLIGSDVITGSLAREAGENLGLYNILIGSLEIVSSNYLIDFVSGVKFEITPASLENVKLESKTVTYNNQEHSLYVTGAPTDATVTYYVDGVEVVGIPSFINAGTYSISAVVEKYGYADVILEAKSLVINKKAATIKADDKTITFQDENVALTATITGAIEGDILNYTLSRELGDNAGDYVISVSLGENPNYTLTANTGIYKILKAQSLITADDINKVYDGNTYTIVASLNHSEASLSYSNNNGQVNVGEYEVTIEVEASTNYLAGLVKRTITITAKPITVTPNSASKIYGALDPEFSYQVAGLIGEDKLSGALARAVGEDVGNYLFKVGTLANSNYSITVEAVNFVVKQRALIITIDNKSSNRLVDLVQLTYQLKSGTIVNEDNLGVSLSTNANNDVAGTYAITGNYTNLNYDITFEDGVYTVKALEYNVDFYVEGIKVKSEIIVENTKVDKPTDPEKIDYTFAFWCTDVELENAFDFDTLINKDYILYAKFTINKYTITFNSAGGSEVDSITQDYNTTIIPPANPTKVGYTFSSWSPALPEKMPSGGLEVTAQWTAIDYTISFNSNGGTSVTSITQGYDTAITPPANPTKTGYNFSGWSPALPTKMPLGGLEVTAQWIAIDYTISFNSDGGTSVTSITQGYETTITPPTNPTKAGYTFKGWNPELPATMPLNGISLTAVWQAVEYQINYYLDGGTNHNDNPLTYTIVTPKITLNAATKEGHTFAGWYSASVGGTRVYNIELGSMGNIDLYARYTVREYTITYKVDGEVHKEEIYPYGSSITILADPVKTGYSFSGWDIVVFPEVMPAINITINGTFTINKYTITFNSAGGSAVAVITQDYNSAITPPTNPTKTGYSFNGWSPALQAKMPLGGLEVTAQWIANTYTVSFDTNDNDIIVTYDSFYGSLPTPTKVGYSFSGWYKDSLEGTLITSEMKVTTANNHQLYAKWTANSYKVTFNYNDASGGDETIDKNVTYDSLYGLLPTPTKVGYTFLGWYKDSLEGDLITSESKVATATNHNLYAKWEINTYTVRFKDYDGAVLKIQYVTYGSSATAPEEDPTRTGYNFTGWSKSFSVVENDLDIEAVYQIITYTVTFKNYDGNNFDIQIVDHGSTASLPTDPSNNGYLFSAWYIDIELANIYDFNNGVTEDITLYPAWELEFYTWEIISIFEKEDLDDPKNIFQDPDQTPTTRERINLYYGLEVNPVLAYEGYLFNYFVYDGDEYHNIDELIAVTGSRTGDNSIKVYYRKIILTITFAQDPDLFNPKEDAIKVYRIYYNDTFEIPEDLVLAQPADDPHFGARTAFWDRTQFNNVKDNVVVYAIYHLIGIKTVIFIDSGVIKYIAQERDNIGTLILKVISEDSILWDLKKAGYKFLGWYTAETGGEQVMKGDLLFADFEFLTTTLYARWEKLTPFSAPKNISISTSEGDIIISWTVDPATINNEEPAGFIYLLNNNLIKDLDTKPVLSGTRYTLTLSSSNPDYDLFKELLEPGNHELRIRALGDDNNHYQSGYSDVYDYSLDSIYEGEPTEVAVYDYFIIESFGDTKRYIFYTNLNYQFAGNSTFEIITGHEVVSVDGNAISTKGIAGAFRFRVIKEGEQPKVYDALVVHDIKQFEIGNNYQNYLTAKGEQTTFLKAAQEYYIGNQNEFYLDLRIVNNKGQRIALSQTQLEYDLYYYNNGNYEQVAENNIEAHLEIIDNNLLILKSNTIGNKYKIVVRPKYQASSMEVSDAEFEFVVNGGVNVYTNQQLKDAYSNINVKIINIHASFNAELLTTQKNADGSPINKRPTQAAPVTGNVYQRFSPSTDDDDIVIEGNYMTIDGSNLPYANSDSGSGNVGFAQAFVIVNMQIGMFYYGTGPNGGAVNNSSFKVNNLIIKGNTSTPYVDFSGSAEDIEIQERLMSKNSGGYMGFFIHGGEFTVDNVVILNTVLAISNNSYSYKDEDKLEPNYVYANYLKTYNNWANTLYLHTALGYIVKDSYIGQSGGSAVHMVDTLPAEFDESGNLIRNPNPYLYLDETTIVNNWISGEEAWFKAYGMTQTALTLKSGIESGIKDTGRSVIKLVKDPISGLETEMINFILLTEPSTMANKYSDPEKLNQISGSEVGYNLDGINIQRPFNFLNADPRVNNNQFAFPVSNYSEFINFYLLINEIAGMITLNYPQGTPEAIIQKAATDLATLAAFYGLSAEQVVHAYGAAGQQSGKPFKQAVESLYPGQAPKYLEVLAPVPVFESGYSNVIIQFAD